MTFRKPEEASRCDGVNLHLTQISVPYESAVRLHKIRDTYDWHQKIWDAFGNSDLKSRNFLVRIDLKEEAFRVIVLSRTIPAKPDWCPSHCFATRVIPSEFLAQQYYQFSLLANPTKKMRVILADGSRKKNGRRVAVSDHNSLVKWLERKADVGGFAIDDASLRITPKGREYFHKDSRSFGAHSAVEFQGKLEVLDSVKFRNAFAQGIGSAKAFGFGLLLLAPITVNPKSKTQ